MTSDDFQGNPYGAATNQCGHFALGLGVVVALGIAHWWAVIVAVLIYWLIAEYLMQGLSMWRDSIMDTAHVMAGAGFGAYATSMAHDQTLRIIVLSWGALLAYETWSKR